ncbi:endothelial differentiation-related factor 1 homolog isoform X1 [Hemibagrus wyckioides]|uniref:endothelial differentiation-related factor 1 homolog isoform X1 n=1 Tax=Hemibagrus wyckioides TaxID=337641 RepID=UPI00266C000B|nr:endothelial differentiation-related factor 1 homolog isoform X1 [Hemibagrus wyckioides]
MAESDWDTVTVLRKKGSASQAKSRQAVTAAQRRGEDVETTKKWAAGQNKQHVVTKNTAKLDRETEELHHDRVPLEVGKVIQQGRQNKGLTQKDLATWKKEGYASDNHGRKVTTLLLRKKTPKKFTFHVLIAFQHDVSCERKKEKKNKQKKNMYQSRLNSFNSIRPLFRALNLRQ